MTKTIDTEELKRKIDGGGDFVLVEVLAEKPYRRGHIPGAVNIPYRTIGGEARRRFDPEQEIVVYCADSSCRASGIAAEKLESMGFENVRHYEGGKKAWTDAGYPLEGGGE